MKVFVFSSYNITNIWASIGACQWAVSKRQADNKALQTRAKGIPIGSFGIFYCNPKGMGVFTTPFIIYSKPDPERIVKDIWPEEWKLPFKIVPLGSPKKQIKAHKLTSLLPSLKGKQEKWNELLYVSGGTAFAPSKISEMDWEILFSELSGV